MSRKLDNLLYSKTCFGYKSRWDSKIIGIL